MDVPAIRMIKLLADTEEYLQNLKAVRLVRTQWMRYNQ